MSMVKEGVKFAQVTPAAAWSERYGAGVLVFQGKLWVMGGTVGPELGRQMNDVWSSPDGVTWRKELAAAPWSPRWCHVVFNFNNKIWLIGGMATCSPKIVNLNDIWSSPDGVTWTREVADAPWVARHVWSPMIHNGRMCLIAGATDGQLFHNDVLSTMDGVNWKTQTATGPWFEKRKCQAGVSFGGKMWITGGSIIDKSEPGGGRYLNDAWSSPDGNNWTKVTDSAAWSLRCFHDLISYRDRMWLISGNFGRWDYGTDVWSSTDGSHWSLEHDHFPWPPRHAHGAVVFNDKIWILGGVNEAGARNDIWTMEATR